jgi:hypothetical protein
LLAHISEDDPAAAKLITLDILYCGARRWPERF